MKIYKISHNEDVWDACNGHCVIANTTQEVISLAQSVCGDEGVDIWKKSKIEEIGEYTGNSVTPFIILTSYRS